MSVRNTFFRSSSGEPNPRALEATGAYTAVEIHVPTALEQQLGSTGQAVPRPVLGVALVDTGASRTVVDAEAVEQLGLSPIGVADFNTAAGPSSRPVYPARLEFPALETQIDFSSIGGVDLTGQTLPDGETQFVCLIGRDILSRGVLIYNGIGGMWTIAF